ncbi:LAFA_0E03026g1_1 [Lachancea sp. 'fantastica']|nr:LAFA_0E03026g1_1 [Lachancea sp. 'fantastica']
MSRTLTRYGNLLDSGKFVSRYGSNGYLSKTSSTSKELVNAMTLDRYSTYLNNYNCFVLLRPRKNEVHLKNQNLLWRSFCGEVKSFYRDSSKTQSDLDFTIAPSPVFFEKPPKLSLLDKLLDSELNCDGRSWFCFFQNLDSLHSTAAFRQYLEHTKSSTDPATRFEPVVVAINMGDHNSTAISCIQPLLEDSSQMYRDLDYDKLLKIAKQSQTKSSDPMRKEVKSLLEALAENRILVPRMTKRARWLLLTVESFAADD